ncbi:MAG: hypothetical protein P8I94_06965 [Emcibacteraceae bacterium]|nr:hypothetical protein [Emcibacteraceae bacterium]
MATITLNFNNPINVSVQANSESPLYPGADIVYFQNQNEEVYKIGPCIAVTETSITCYTEDSALRPSASDFIFFAKSPEVNTSGVAGYYAEVDMEITSTSKKELFAVNSNVFISS